VAEVLGEDQAGGQQRGTINAGQRQPSGCGCGGGRGRLVAEANSENIRAQHEQQFQVINELK
jgi:hypothetical protein